MMKYEAEALRRNPPRFAAGETVPDSPVYWLIWLLNEDNGLPYHSRCCWNKTDNPVEACRQTYGMIPTKNTLFFNLTSRLADARKLLRKHATEYRRLHLESQKRERR